MVKAALKHRPPQGEQGLGPSTGVFRQRPVMVPSMKSVRLSMTTRSRWKLPSKSPLQLLGEDATENVADGKARKRHSDRMREKVDDGTNGQKSISKKEQARIQRETEFQVYRDLR